MLDAPRVFPTRIHNARACAQQRNVCVDISLRWAARLFGCVSLRRVSCYSKHEIIFPLEREPPVDHCIVERRWTISIRAGRNNSPWVVKWFNRFFFFSREGSVKKFLRLEIRHYLPFNRNASPSFYRVDFFWNALSFSFLFQRLWEREREKNTVTFWIYFKVTLLR